MDLEYSEVEVSQVDVEVEVGVSKIDQLLLSNIDQCWPSGLGKYFLCKIFAFQTLLRSLEFVIQINLEHDTIAEKYDKIILKHFQKYETKILFYELDLKR